jgi:hypothetical protein
MNGYESSDKILKSLKLWNDLELGTNADVLGLVALQNSIPPCWKGDANL